MAKRREENKAAQRKYMKDYDRCELCGSKKNLQCHHIIPLSTSIVGCDIDVEDNFLCVCSACHAKLTPKNLIVRYSMAKQRFTNEKDRIAYYFYKNVQDALEDNSFLSACDMMDIFDKTLNEFESKTA